jgi:hypothetical protein
MAAVSASTVSTGKPVGACMVVRVGMSGFGAFVVLAALSRGDDRGPPHDIVRDWLLVELSAVEYRNRAVLVAAQFRVSRQTLHPE